MIISPAFVIAAIYLTYKITKLVVIILWWLLVALWLVVSWPFKAAVAVRR